MEAKLVNAIKLIAIAAAVFAMSSPLVAKVCMAAVGFDGPI